MLNSERRVNCIRNWRGPSYRIRSGDKDSGGASGADPADRTSFALGVPHRGRTWLTVRRFIRLVTLADDGESLRRLCDRVGEP
jgi:hypothetical protein